MKKYNKHSQKLISECFSLFNGEDINYVITHDFCDLPRRVHGSDVDILISPDDFPKAVGLCESLFGESNNRLKNTVCLFIDSLWHPKKAINHVFNPSKLKLVMKREIVAGDKRSKYNLIDGFQTEKFRTRDNEILLDLNNSLVYKNPFTNKRCRAHPHLQNYILCNRMSTNGYYTPNPPAELVHVISRCLSGKRGTFPNYHLERCEHLKEIVFSDEVYESDFEKLLNYQYKGVAELIYTLARDNKYEGMFSKLTEYDAY